jgi:hypothetical protein
LAASDPGVDHLQIPVFLDEIARTTLSALKTGSIGLTPAMAAAITGKLWSVEDIVALVEANEPKSGKRWPYKKRAA